ncbi:MAG TPA: hypothetical protein VD793_03075 [Gemmatimonadales bacterium]|nr:hypothetical protein [Gemmatimonadales bacterium]
MTGMRKLWVRVAAPAILLGGVGIMTGATRAREMKTYLRTFADSMKHGSGPVELAVRFVPFYVEGERLGFVNRLVIARHEAGTVDSVRVMVSPRSNARVARATDCHLRLVSFDPGDFKHALVCESEAADLVRFGSVDLGLGASAVPLYLDQVDHTCAPWRADRDACRSLRESVRVNVRNEMHHARAEARRIRNEVRARVRAEVGR